MQCQAVFQPPSTPRMQALKRGVWVSMNITLKSWKGIARPLIVVKVCSLRHYSEAVPSRVSASKVTSHNIRYDLLSAVLHGTPQTAVIHLLLIRSAPEQFRSLWVH